MQSLTPEDIAATVALEGRLLARADSGAFTLRFSDDQPFLCLAIHNGHAMRADVSKFCALTETDRLSEEDLHTGDLLAGLQNTLVAHDSRYEYDLNRSPEEAIYGTAWGAKVWRKPLPAHVREQSLEKYHQFYTVLRAAVERLVQKHGGCVVYDLHSYSGPRQDGVTAPLFNIGTHSIDMRRHRRSVEFMERALGEITIANEAVRVGRDEVFEGRGHIAAYIRAEFKDVLCLPIEVKKVFCSEDDGAPFPAVIDALKAQLTSAISSHAAFFARSKLERRHAESHHMLGAGMDATVRKVDKALYRLARKVETLLYVNPVNLAQEQKRFIARHGNYEPHFHYRHLRIDPYLFREALYRLPVEEITDPSLQKLYRDAIDGLATKIDLLKTIGTRDFMYNSLRYYGEPHANDLNNAAFLLHAPTSPAEQDGHDEPPFETGAIVKAIQKAVDSYGIDAPVKTSSSIVAGAMVDNANFRVFVKKNAKLNQKSVNALIHHEVGVHLLSASNARAQSLKVLRLGFPGTTMTQEGIAVFAEHLGGTLSVARLKTLGLRVVAVKSLLDGHTFSQTYAMLTEDHGASPANAFITTARVYRGGGFTKDFLYLRGVAQARNYHRSGKDWKPLFAGKIPFSKVDQIEELVARGIVTAPERVANAFGEPADIDPILDYLMSGLVFTDT